MNFLPRFIPIVAFSLAIAPLAPPAQGQSAGDSLCPAPVLSRLTRYRVASGDTLQSIAQARGLIPATLMGLNPSLRGGRAPVGSEILIPPVNGIRVEVPPGQSLRDVAKRYGVRADVLFEANGCQPKPRVVFIPGVNWAPQGTATQAMPQTARQILAGSPLPGSLSEAGVLLGYGYVVPAGASIASFHSGIDLAAPVSTVVSSVGNGTVAFVGTQGAYGTLVVINHAEGLQTRYGQLGQANVKVGQRVQRGQAIARVGSSGRPSSAAPHLHFEVRSRSSLGWVAENPSPLLFSTPPRPAAQAGF
jgi:murein DD-endopeptidase MepM/ murein hydrolase activator NlpD